MCLPYSVEELRKTVDELQESHRSLETTKEALVKSEKLASMGQLAAGIAHEVNNPLGHPAAARQSAARGLRGRHGRRPTTSSSSSTRRTAARRSSPGCSTSPVRAASCGSPPTWPPSCRRCCAPSPSTRASRSTVDDRLSDPIAELDADQIVQVLTNLLTNAQHALPDGGRVLITLDGTEENVIVMVVRRRHRHRRGAPRQALQPVLHHQAGGQGHRPRSRRDARHRQDAPRPDHRGVQRRPVDKGPTQTTFTIVLPRYEGELNAPASLQEIMES